MSLHESSQSHRGEAAESAKLEGAEKGPKDDLNVLQGSCRGYIGRLGRQYKDIEVLLADTRNYDLVVKQFKILKRLFNSYENKFNQLYSLLEGTSAEDALDKFHAQETNFNEFCSRVTEWTASIKENASERNSTVSDGKSFQSKASSLKFQEAKGKMELARRKKAQLLEIHKLKRQQIELEQKLAEMQIENEITNAEEEFKVLEEEEFTVDNASEKELGAGNRGKTIGHIFTKPDQVSTPDAPHGTGGGQKNLSPPNSKVNEPQALYHAISTAVNMPKLEMITFSGDPTEFWGFISNHEANIGSKAIDDKMKLTYLIQNCKGKARESIEDCVLLKPNEGYQKAIDILRDQFGQPHIICHSLLSKVLSRPQIRPNDGVALWSLARVMRKCQVTVEQMGYGANLDSTDTLLKIQRILPIYLQSDWAKKAYEMISSGVDPNFLHMTEFVEKAAKAANSMYGSNIGKGAKEDRQKSKGNSSSRKASAFATKNGSNSKEDRVVKCPCCNGEHNLALCEVFQGKSQKERFRLVRRLKLCDNCFKPFHTAFYCKLNSGCKVNGCDRKHHSLLHWAPKELVQDKGLDGAGAGEDPVPEESSPQATNMSMVSSQRVCMKVLPVKVESKGSVVTTWALLDSGSDTSLCERELVEELGLSGQSKTFNLRTVTGNENALGFEVSLIVGNMTGREYIEMPKVLTIDKLPISTENMPTQEDVSKWPHLKGVDIPVTDLKEVKLLIGSDTPEAFWVEEQRKGRRKEPYAVRTPLGWTLLGPISKDRRNSNTFTVNNISQTCTRTDDQLHQQIKRFWELDHSLGKDEESFGESQEDKRARSVFEDTVRLKEGHYEIGMPWRNFPPDLSDNRGMAMSRLLGLKRRFKRDADLFKQYKVQVKDYIDKGYAREVPESEVTRQGEPVWYLPHHPVINPKKPGKVRVVFDCAAEFKGRSLNSQLLHGPDFTNNLVGVLTRFRQEKIALVSDIEAMFHQVRVTPRDTNMLRFLWWPDGNILRPVKHYQMVVHLFGATSSPSCTSFALRRTAEDNKSDFDDDIATTVYENFYVDDCLKSVESVTEAKRIIPQLCEMLRRGGFKLTKWMSNQPEVLVDIPNTEKAKSVVNCDLDHMPTERTLGVSWDTKVDKFTFNVSLKDVQPTRRGILSATSSLFDPLGFVAPFILRAKILLQDLCAESLRWDEEVGEQEEQRWRNWLSESHELENIKTERCLKPSNSVNVRCELHIFCDASERAYAAVAYLRTLNLSGGVHCSFVMGRARLSPLKRVTIPRLELMAAVLAAELGQIIRDELRLPVGNVMYWTDSTSVLNYIRNESRRFRVFVANRVAKIQRLSDVDHWRYVDSKSNPADDGSRGLNAHEIQSNSRWLKGPDFLWMTEDCWPLLTTDFDEIGPVISEEVVADPELSKRSTCMLVSDDPIRRFIESYSSWYRLQRGMAWLLRYKKFLMTVSKGKRYITTNDLSVEELKEAENEIVKWVQRESFPGVMKSPTNWKGTAFRKLSPVLVQGVLRVGGRLSRSQLNYDRKHPLILPSDHHVTRLIIEHHHSLVGHMGASMTWTSLRDHYWVMRGGATVRKVIGKCLACRKRNAPPGQQYMADLPEPRVTADKPPFSSVGIDLFGPFLVKQGRSSVKRWGCIFTCLAMRAVHIELLDTMDTDSFINALRRFISRRGQPDRIFSDNGTNFKAGDKELREALARLDENKIGRHLRKKGIEWTFNPPAASHMGGAWERMIRSVRRVLKVLLKGQTVTHEVLETTLTEVEAILNSRPLTQLSLDPRDNEPLTPNHLLLLRDSPNLSPGVFNKNDGYGRRRWRQCQYLVNQFWKRWLREYLPLLQERQKWYKTCRNYKVKDLVLLVDEGNPRGKWSLGRVVQVFPDKAGLVRQVDVRVGHKYFRRPISKLCLLEAGDEENENGDYCK